MDYARAKATATRLIRANGAAVTLNRVERSYNPATSATTAVTTASHTGTALQLRYGERSIDGIRVMKGDLRLLMETDTMPRPEAGDEVIVGASTYEVVSVEEEAPGGIALLYDVQIRGVKA